MSKRSARHSPPCHRQRSRTQLPGSSLGSAPAMRHSANASAKMRWSPPKLEMRPPTSRSAPSRAAARSEGDRTHPGAGGAVDTRTSLSETSLSRAARPRISATGIRRGASIRPRRRRVLVRRSIRCRRGVRVSRISRSRGSWSRRRRGRVVEVPAPLADGISRSCRALNRATDRTGAVDAEALERDAFEAALTVDVVVS